MEIDQNFLEEIVRCAGNPRPFERLPGRLCPGTAAKSGDRAALLTKPAVLLADEPTGT